MTPRTAAQLLHQVERLSPALARLIEHQLGKLAARVSLEEIEDALRRGDVEALIRAARLDDLRLAIEAGLVRQGVKLLEVVGAWAAGEAAVVAGQAVSWEVVKDQVLAAAKRAAAERVVAITADMRAHLRTLITDAIEDDALRRKVAKQIRQVIPLDPRRAAALEKLRVRTDALVGSGQLTRKEAGQLVGQYHRALKHDRAWSIARTELHEALEGGRLATWEVAQARGLLPKSAQKRWIGILRDGKICRICHGAHGQTVALGADFALSTGKKVRHPPGHPKCRCSQQLVAARDAQPVKPPFVEPKRGKGLRPKLPRLVQREPRAR